MNGNASRHKDRLVDAARRSILYLDANYAPLRRVTVAPIKYTLENDEEESDLHQQRCQESGVPMGR